MLVDHQSSVYARGLFLGQTLWPPAKVWKNEQLNIGAANALEKVPFHIRQHLALLQMIRKECSGHYLDMDEHAH